MSYNVRVCHLEDQSVAWASYASEGAVHPIEFGVCEWDDLWPLLMSGLARFRSVYPSDGSITVDTY